MEYKGFTGSKEWSPDDFCFFGKILNINDLVSYEGSTTKELEEEFIKAVDDYIADQKELSKTMNIDDIADAADEITRRNNNILPVYKPAESLTLENFWNDLISKYPKGMKVFYDWIDAYKKAVNWDKIFNAEITDDGYFRHHNPYTTNSGDPVYSPKYHDLPFAMQIGIWMAFVHWCLVIRKYEIKIDIVPIVIPAESWKYSIENFIAELQCIKDRDNEL